jgi:hypothetical protein
MTSGMTNPSVPWFRLAVEDDELSQSKNVKVWLDQVTNLMLKIANRSNIYGVFQNMYEEIGIFGTACAIIEEDDITIIRGRSFTAGEYFLGVDDKGIVDTFGREFELTVSQMVTRFGLENCSEQVKNFYENNRLDIWIKVNHLIEPNDDRCNVKVSKDFKFRSIYWEEGKIAEGFLRTKGYYEFPVLAPRWDTITTDLVYGYGPGWHALGNIKQLQKTVLDKMMAQEKIHNPPTTKDSSVEGHVNLLPGGVTTSNSNMPNSGVRATYQINPNLESFLELIQSLKDSISKSFYTN